MLQAIQSASIASKVIALQCSAPMDASKTFSNRQLSIPTLLFLATLGGAQVCALEHQIGSFAPGKSFDALLVRVTSAAGNPGLWCIDSPLVGDNSQNLHGMLESFMFCGDDRNIARVYVQGKLVGGTSFQ